MNLLLAVLGTPPKKWVIRANKIIMTIMVAVTMAVIANMNNDVDLSKHPTANGGAYFMFAFQIVTLVAIWSRPEKRKARWTATVWSILLAGIYVYFYCTSWEYTYVIAAFIAACQLLGIWIGAYVVSTPPILAVQASVEDHSNLPFQPTIDKGPLTVSDSVVPTANVSASEKPQFCAVCGHKFEAEFSFCPKCGRPRDSGIR